MMPFRVPIHTNPASTQHHDSNPSLFLATRDNPSASNNADSPEAPVPELSESATLGITLGIVAAVVLFLLIWYFRRRSKHRRAGDTRRSGLEKWDPVQGTTPPPSRTWVDEDVERQFREDQGASSRFDGSVQIHAGRVWGAPKWNAVAERMAQHGRQQRECSMELKRGARLSKPPPAMTRRPAAEWEQQQNGTPEDESYVAMLWNPGNRGTLQ
ncbi:hypothetical protein VUR80DRAFT_7532 [Thermomyces stellatus]